MKGLAFDRKHPAIADVLTGLKRTRRRPIQQKAPLIVPAQTSERVLGRQVDRLTASDPNATMARTWEYRGPDV